MQKFVGLGADVGEKIGGLLRTWIRLQPCQFAHHLLKVGQRLVHIRMGIRINPRHGGLDLVSRYLGTRYFAGRDFASWLRRRESLRGCRLDLALVVQRSVSDFLPPWVPGGSRCGTSEHPPRAVGRAGHRSGTSGFKISDRPNSAGSRRLNCDLEGTDVSDDNVT